MVTPRTFELRYLMRRMQAGITIGVRLKIPSSISSIPITYIGRIRQIEAAKWQLKHRFQQKN